MDSSIRFKEWINENVPILSHVYENKYVGMLYDRFASLPPKQQRQVIYGALGGITAIVLGYLVIAYLSLWSTTSSVKESYRMATLLVQYQKQRRDRSQSIRALSRNTPLAAQGQLRQHLIDLGRSATISPKMIVADEKADQTSPSDGKTGNEVRAKRASITLSRVTVVQMMRYMRNLESGQYDLSISSVRVTNDDKLRGYMKVELGVVAYVFEGDEL